MPWKSGNQITEWYGKVQAEPGNARSILTGYQKQSCWRHLRRAGIDLKIPLDSGGTSGSDGASTKGRYADELFWKAPVPAFATHTTLVSD
jgi:hypothetical protein